MGEILHIYELKKWITFTPVHSPFSTFSAFLKENTEEIEKLSLRTWNKKNLFQENQ